MLSRMLRGKCQKCGSDSWDLLPRDGIRLRKVCQNCGATEWRYEGPRHREWNTG